jgi:ribosomal protein S18 acetylase RimI-like enzyme
MDSLRLTPELLPSAADLLARAFFDNPAHVYLCPDPRTRLSRLLWLLGANLRLQPDLTRSFCLAEGSVVTAMGFWTRSGFPRVGILARLRAGLLAAPFRLGLPTLQRSFEVTRGIEQELDAALGEEPFWYLNNMAVREPLRGGGIGSRLLREQLRILGEADPDAPCALATQRSENVVFYGRLGFRVVRDRAIGSAPGAFRNWIMVRPPA